MLVQLDESARLWNFECVSSTSNLFILSSFKNEVFVQFSIVSWRENFVKKKKKIIQRNSWIRFHTCFPKVLGQNYLEK